MSMTPGDPRMIDNRGLSRGVRRPPTDSGIRRLRTTETAFQRHQAKSPGFNTPQSGLNKTPLVHIPPKGSTTEPDRIEQGREPHWYEGNYWTPSKSVEGKLAPLARRQVMTWPQRIGFERERLERVAMLVLLAGAAPELLGLEAGAAPLAEEAGAAEIVEAERATEAAGRATGEALSNPSILPVARLRATEKALADPEAANNMRYLAEWLKEGGISLRRGERLLGDSKMRTIARRALRGLGIDIEGLDAGHLLDAAVDPLRQLEPGRRTVYGFINQSVNRSFGGQLIREFERLGIKVGDEFTIEWEGFP